MQTSYAQYDWIKEVKPENHQLNAIPLTGAAPPFPWTQLSTLLTKTFEKEQILLQPKELVWRTKDQLLEGLGDDVISLNFNIPNLQGNVYWVMPQQEITLLESALLTKDNAPIHLHDKALSDAFYQFLILETLFNFNKIDFDKSLSPILKKKNDFPGEDSLSLDITIQIDDQVLWGRLVISKEFRSSWVDYFEQKGKVSPLAQKLAEQIDIVVGVAAGQTQLNREEWSKVTEGDWIALDQFSLDIDTLEGPVTLNVDGKNAFRGELKDGNVKIIDFSLFQNIEEVPMAKENQEQEEHKDDEEEDFDFDELSEGDEDLDLDDSTFDLDENENTTTMEHPFEEKEGEEPEIPTKEEPKKAAPPQPQAKKPTPIESTTPHHISSRDINVSLIVEIGQVKMTMDKLLSLEPGNMLDLNIRPEDGVNLVVNGKTIGKGELIRIGDSIGVRILDLG